MSKTFEFPWKKKKRTPERDTDSLDLDSGEIKTVEEQQVADERALPSVNKSRSLNSKIMNMLTIGGMVALGAFILFKYYANLIENRKADEAAITARDKTSEAALHLPPLTKHEPETDLFGLDKPDEPPTPRVGAIRITAQDPNQYGGAPPVPKPDPDETARNRKKAAPVLFNVDAGDAATMMRVDAARTPTQGLGGDDRGDDLADALRPTRTPGVKASVLPDRDLFITKGTFLECVLEPALDTKMPGMVSCILSRDVRGASGNVVLLEKGTKLTGEYHGEVKGNDARVFLLWSLAETPEGVTVELDSPGTDPLGRSGVNGYVNTHFRERFGAAMLISVLEDVTGALTNRSGGGDTNTIILPSTIQNGKSLAQEALKQDASIKHTLTKNQGAHINVYVARHLDFRGVYRLERTR